MTTLNKKMNTFWIAFLMVFFFAHCYSVHIESDFNVGLNNNYKIHKEFGCITESCAINTTWNIYGETCINPRLSISVIDNFYQTYQSAAFWLDITITINGTQDISSTCNGDTPSCSYDWSSCPTFQNYSLSKYFDQSDESPFNVSLSILLHSQTELLTRYNCPYEIDGTSYYMYAAVTINCDVPINISTSYPTSSPTTLPQCYYQSMYVGNNSDGVGDSDKINDLTFNIQFDNEASGISWVIIDDIGLNIDDSDDDDDDNGGGIIFGIANETLDNALYSQTICVADYDCFELYLYDSDEDNPGLDENYAWFSLELNNNDNNNNNNNNNGQFITWNEKQSFSNSDGIFYLYFCASLFLQTNFDNNFDNGSNSNSNSNSSIYSEYYFNPTNNLTIVINYDTQIEITNISNGAFLYYNTIDNSYYQESGSGIGKVELSIADGCYDITFLDDNSDNEISQIDDDYLTLTIDTDDSISVTKFGEYTVYMNGDIVAVGGYYDESETHTICTDSNHVSYCIIPEHCINNKEYLFVTEYETNSLDVVTANAPSYHSLFKVQFPGNDTYYYVNSESPVNVECFGSNSCENSLFYATIQRCYSTFSCANSTNFENLVMCAGSLSCAGMSMGTSLQTYAMQSISSLITSQNINQYGLSMTGDFGILQVRGTLTMMNTDIFFESGFALSLEFGYYSVYNVTIYCGDSATVASAFCLSSFSYDHPQFIMFDQSCQDIRSIFGCERLYSNISHLDNNTLDMMDDISILMNNMQDIVYNDCDNTSSSYSFDIGYTLNAETSIINNNQFGSVCCRGQQSCAVTDSIRTNYGNILCLGYQSCEQSNLLWTDTTNVDLTSSNLIDISAFGNIYCTAVSSCTGAILEAANSIICSAYLSCSNAVILDAKSLYCSDRACDNIVVRNVDSIYFMDKQDGAIIYSGGIGISKFYLRGDLDYLNGNFWDLSPVFYYCEYGDECYIDCDEYFGCDWNLTLLNCDGKCFITGGCNMNISDPQRDETKCPRILASLAPSQAPTDAPSSSPTTTPTNEPTKYPTIPPTFGGALLTEGQLVVWFNWILGILVAVSVLLIVLGIVDAFGLRKNELFEWPGIAVFVFYTNDFISDLFFTLKLYILAFDENVSSNNVYLRLFVCSLVFLFVPLMFNIIQLHLQISKWTKDRILKHTPLPQWINFNLKFLYCISVLCGSSFSAIALCNSYLFQIPLFSMGLSHYHRSIFQNKRFWSIVCLEVE